MKIRPLKYIYYEKKNTQRNRRARASLAYLQFFALAEVCIIQYYIQYIESVMPVYMRTHCLFLRFLSRLWLSFYLFIFFVVYDCCALCVVCYFFFLFHFALLCLSLRFSFCSSHHIQISIKKLFLIHFTTLYNKQQRVVLMCAFYTQNALAYAHRPILFGFAVVLSWLVVFFFVRLVVLSYSMLLIFSRYCVQNALCFLSLSSSRSFSHLVRNLQEEYSFAWSVSICAFQYNFLGYSSQFGLILSRFQTIIIISGLERLSSITLGVCEQCRSGRQLCFESLCVNLSQNSLWL